MTSSWTTFVTDRTVHTAYTSMLKLSVISIQFVGKLVFINHLNTFAIIFDLLDQYVSLGAQVLVLVSLKFIECAHFEHRLIHRCSSLWAKDVLHVIILLHGVLLKTVGSCLRILLLIFGVMNYIRCHKIQIEHLPAFLLSNFIISIRIWC